jgi:hypothetical protein
MAFILVETKGDLFTSNESLAHCVGQDLIMGAGIATEFKKRFMRVSLLKKQGAKVGEMAVLQDESRFIYYLVTKKYSVGKPTYESLEKSLIALRDHMIANNVLRLSIPRIGCGLDKLDWPRVRALIKRVFQDVKYTTITVYRL